MQMSQIPADGAGTFAICDPWACLLSLQVPHLLLPPLLCRHLSALLFTLVGWAGTVRGRRELGQACRCREERGSPAVQGAGGGGSLISPGVRITAAEKSRGSPLPFPGRTGRRQHLLKLWSLALPVPGAIWKALLRKPWTHPKSLGSGAWAKLWDLYLEQNLSIRVLNRAKGEDWW